MITTYNGFITESKSKYKNYQPEYYGIYSYDVVDGLINCKGEIKLEKFPLSKLPFKFGVVDSGFKIMGENLTSLLGCPKETGGYFKCSENPKLKSLEGCPKIVNGNFVCEYNDSLKNYDHCPEYVSNIFFCGNNNTIAHPTEEYPMCIIGECIMSGYDTYDIIFKLIKENEESFKPLIGNRKAFNQHIMRLRPDLIKYYKNTPPPPTRTII